MEINSREEWEELLRKAEANDVDAQNEAAFIYEHGLAINGLQIVDVDKTSARFWIKKAYENGSVDAMTNLAHYLTDRDSKDRDIELGMSLYETAMNLGDDYAAYCLGLEYRNKQNFEKAFELYNKAHRKEDFYKELTIAMCYYHGVGVNQDRQKAFEIFKSLKFPDMSQYEVDEANYMIGRIYLEGEVVEKDLDKAREYLELADSDGDHRSAQEILYIIGRRKLIES